MSALLALLLAASSSFPLPTIDGKPISVTPKQHVFRLPMRFDKVKAFYADQLKADVTQRQTGSAGTRVLTLTNQRKTDAWVSATVTEKDMETVIDVKAVLVMDEQEISGNGKPLVEFIFSRSPEVEKSLQTIDREHLERLQH